MTEGHTAYKSLVESPSLDGSLPPYSAAWSSDQTMPQRPQKRSSVPIGRVLPLDSMKQRTQIIIHRTRSILKEEVWPFCKRNIFKKKQLYGLSLLLLAGVAPVVTLSFLTDTEQRGPFYDVFAAKVISCGFAFEGNPQNSTVVGIEGLFVLDYTFGRLPFSQVKLIDVAWDVGLGRGVQLLAWWTSYKVFSDALLRVIERHPASFRTFTHITLEGPSPNSLWALLKGLVRTKSKRTWALYFYMALSTIWVMSIPVLLSTMTGYTSTAKAWVDVAGNDQIVPASSLEAGYILNGIDDGNVTLTINNTCSATEQIRNAIDRENEGDHKCDCQWPNGNITSRTYWIIHAPHVNVTWLPWDCIRNYTGNTQTYTSQLEGKQKNCNESSSITILGKQYPIWALNYTNGYCYEDEGYDYLTLNERTRCLPDTTNPSYQWGFSTMLSGVFIFIQFGWALSMYVVWQDAQINSKLVNSGYFMTQLRAAFTIATAATWRTGFSERVLARVDTKQLERSLYGTRTKREGEVCLEMFLDDEVKLEDDQGLRQRNSRARDDE